MWRSKEAAIHRLVIHSEIARPAPRLTKSTAIRQSLQNAGQGIYQPPLPCYCLDSGHYASERPIILKHCPTPTRPHNCCCLGKYPAPPFKWCHLPFPSRVQQMVFSPPSSVGKLPLWRAHRKSSESNHGPTLLLSCCQVVQLQRHPVASASTVSIE